jgi:glycosyltransferase involved in cell wall biosynthesis
MIGWLDKVQPELDRMKRDEGFQFETYIIGDQSGVQPTVWERVKGLDAVFTGHVLDLDTVLRPYDIAVIPYEGNTGIRSKLALLLNHSQVIIATRESVSGTLDIEPGNNIVVAERVEQFPSLIQELANNPERRRQIAQAGRALFERNFTLDAQLSAYEQLITDYR